MPEPTLDKDPNSSGSRQSSDQPDGKNGSGKHPGWRRSFKVLRVLVILGFAGFLLGVMAIGAAYLYVADDLPPVAALKNIEMQVPLRVYTRDGKLIAEYGTRRRVPVQYEEVPEQVINAFIAAEDDRFYSHPGVDWMGLVRAAWNLVLTGEKGQGGSTITMQVARNFFLSFEKTYIRKIREIFLALKIERELSKGQIMELYLNKIFLGQRAYGIGAAAEVYFGKTVQELTLPEIAMLAGLPQAPSAYNPIACPECALEQRAYVLRRMRELNYITEAEYQAAKQAPLGVEYHSYIVEVNAPYVGELARKAVVDRFGEEAAYTNGYRVITTIDSRLQPLAVQAVRDGVLAYARRHGWNGPVGKVDMTQQPTAEVLQSVLNDYLDAGQLEPAVVTAVADADAEVQQAQVFTDAGRQLTLPWEGLEWTGAESASALIAPGDIVYIETKTETTAWLAPVPDAQGALVSIDPSDGAIVALVGGFDFQLSKFNRVMDANRQPGSSFKPFIYSAALENGFTPATLVNDAPVVFEDKGLGDAWRPENYSGKFYGPTRLRKGFINSRNLVSIRVLRGTGIDNAIDHITQFGFPRDRMPRNLSLSLGSLSVPPLMMARGFTVFANGGYLIEPYIIQRITGDEEILYEATPAYACGDCIPLPDDQQQTGDTDKAAPRKTALNRQQPVAAKDAVETPGNASEQNEATLELVAPPLPAAPRVINPQNIYLMTDMMRDVIKHGTGRRALVLGRDDLAGKTGTTNNFRDAWFSGFNHALVTTVWLGYDEGKSLGYGEAGSRAALPMWIDYMGPALQGVPEKPLPQPEGIVTVRIDRETGLRVGAGYPDAMFEIFRADRVPPEAPKSLQEQPVDSEGGGLF